jgi:hypothetical protein
VDGWRQIANAAKDYARNGHGKDLAVTVNNGWVNAKAEAKAFDPWPYQDFITVGINPKTVETQSIQDDWDGYKAQIKKVYGSLLTTMFFIDYPNPLSTFSKITRDGQIRLLELLHETALGEGLLFVYPLHGGIISDYMPPPHKIVVYDAVEQGTYETIRHLANSVAVVHSETLTSTISSMATATPTSTASSSSSTQKCEIKQDWGILLLLISVAVVLVAALALRRYRVVTMGIRKPPRLRHDGLPDVPVGGPVCPRCGFANRAGARFCTRDRTDLLAMRTTGSKVCRACGTANRQSASFCRRCRASLR